MGRPTKLTPEAFETIVNAIRLGSTYKLAANAAGATYDSFNNWMNRGKKARRGLYFDFFHAVKKAEGEAVAGWLKLIESAASDGNWQAAAWKLERRYPQDYGRRAIDVQHSGDVKVNLEWGDAELDDNAS